MENAFSCVVNFYIARVILLWVWYITYVRSKLTSLNYTYTVIRTLVLLLHIEFNNKSFKFVFTHTMYILQYIRSDLTSCQIHKMFYENPQITITVRLLYLYKYNPAIITFKERNQNRNKEHNKLITSKGVGFPFYVFLYVFL